MNEVSSDGDWLAGWMDARRIRLWGVADLRGFPTLRDGAGCPFPLAVAWAIPMTPEVMAGIRNGPNLAYADEYARVNDRIDTLSVALAVEFEARGASARALAASERIDPAGFRGAFSHKMAATRAGLGWIGRHCQLVTRPFGSWVRLGTVFTHMALACGQPIDRHFCGRCTRCVEACPAKALTGNAWYPGMPREEMLDARACDEWKTQRYFQYHAGRNCGICAAVCPYGTRALKNRA